MSRRYLMAGAVLALVLAGDCEAEFPLCTPCIVTDPVVTGGAMARDAYSMIASSELDTSNLTVAQIGTLLDSQSDPTKSDILATTVDVDVTAGVVATAAATSTDAASSEFVVLADTLLKSGLGKVLTSVAGIVGSWPGITANVLDQGSSAVLKGLTYDDAEAAHTGATAASMQLQTAESDFASALSDAAQSLAGPTGSLKQAYDARAQEMLVMIKAIDARAYTHAANDQLEMQQVQADAASRQATAAALGSATSAF